jgi:DNA-binding MarR family transcriptional regulator
MAYRKPLGYEIIQHCNIWDCTALDNWELFRIHMQLYRAFMSEVDGKLHKLKLGVKDFFVFRALEFHKNPSDIAAYLILPRPTITFLIKRLEAQGYIRRKSVSGDLRKFEIVFTAKGRRAYKAALSVMTETFEAHVAHVGAAEMKTYAKVVKRLADTAR